MSTVKGQRFKEKKKGWIKDGMKEETMKDDVKERKRIMTGGE